MFRRFVCRETKSRRQCENFVCFVCQSQKAFTHLYRICITTCSHVIAEGLLYSLSQPTLGAITQLLMMTATVLLIVPLEATQPTRTQQLLVSNSHASTPVPPRSRRCHQAVTMLPKVKASRTGARKAEIHGKANSLWQRPTCRNPRGGPNSNYVTCDSPKTSRSCRKQRKLDTQQQVTSEHVAPQLSDDK